MSHISAEYVGSTPDNLIVRQAFGQHHETDRGI
jgi:hypothetical protein